MADTQICSQDCRYRVINAFQALLMACLATVSFCIQAQSDDACQISLESPQIDYGHFTAGQLTRSGQTEYELGQRSVTLFIVCPVPSTVAVRLTVTPSRGSMSSAQFASSGTVPIAMSHASLDGSPADLWVRGKSANKQSEVMVGPGDTVLFESRRGGTRTGIQAQVRVTVAPIVTEADVRVSNQETWKASLLFELADMN